MSMNDEEFASFLWALENTGLAWAVDDLRARDTAQREALARVSRIQLEVVSVRVERLQAGEGETGFESRYLAEGINRIHHGDGEHYYHAMNSDPEPGNWCDPFDAWRELWTSINGQESWDANPWVWVVEFRRVKP